MQFTKNQQTQIEKMVTSINAMFGKNATYNSIKGVGHTNARSLIKQLSMHNTLYKVTHKSNGEPMRKPPYRLKRLITRLDIEDAIPYIKGLI